jgi:hypothetical protein
MEIWWFGCDRFVRGTFRINDGNRGGTAISLAIAGQDPVERPSHASHRSL